MLARLRGAGHDPGRHPGAGGSGAAPLRGRPLTATRQQREVYLGASPAGGHRADASRQGAGPAARPRLRGAQRHQGPRRPGPGPPAHALPRRQSARGDAPRPSWPGCSRRCRSRRPGGRRCLVPQAAASASSASPPGPTWRDGWSAPGSCTSSRSPSRRWWSISWLLVALTGRRIRVTRVTRPRAAGGR